MTIHRVSLSSLLTIPMLTLLSSCASLPPRGADLIVHNAHVMTMSPSPQVASALAIRAGRIVAIGDTNEVMLWRDQHTRLINANGNSVLPGLIDTHIHPVTSAVQRDDCSLDDEKLAVTAIRDKVLACLPVDWSADRVFPVINLNPADFAATRDDLDAISERPFALFGSDGHTAWANTAALRLAGVTAATRDPNNGRITRDASGVATGHLVDDAVSLLSPFLPVDDLATKIAMTKQVIHDLHAVGITSMMEASATEAELQVYAALAQEGALTITTHVALFSEADDSDHNFARLQELRARYDRPSSLRVDTIKIFADGVLEFPTQSAALLQPYLDAHGQISQHAGKLYVDPERLNRFIQRAQAQQFNVHFHAIGDKAVRVALDAAAFARAHSNGAPNRISISHVQLVDPTDVPRFAELDVLASLQLFWAKPENYSVDAVQPYIGPQRSQMMYAARSIVAAGGTITGGSDWNVSSFNPFEAMAAAICRCNENEPERAPLFLDQAVDLATIVKAYTIHAARLLGDEHNTGSLVVGKQADVIVLDRRLDTIDIDRLRATQVQTTIANGRVVYVRERSSTNDDKGAL